MAQPSRLEQLQARRRVLVAQSDELRAGFFQQLLELRAAAGWAERGLNFLRRAQPFWPLLAGLLGLLLAWPGRGRLRWIGRAFSWWRLAKRLFGFATAP